jgi:hypothetical protein
MGKSFAPTRLEDCDSPGSWHVFVCLALLHNVRDALEEMEASEIRTLLQQLPPIHDMESVMGEAARLRHEAARLNAEGS